MKKKLIVTFLIIAMSLSLSACGNNQSDNTVDNEDIYDTDLEISDSADSLDEALYLVNEAENKQDYSSYVPISLKVKYSQSVYREVLIPGEYVDSIIEFDEEGHSVLFKLKLDDNSTGKLSISASQSTDNIRVTAQDSAESLYSTVSSSLNYKVISPITGSDYSYKFIYDSKELVEVSYNKYSEQTVRNVMKYCSENGVTYCMKLTAYNHEGEYGYSALDYDDASLGYKILDNIVIKNNDLTSAEATLINDTARDTYYTGEENLPEQVEVSQDMIDDVKNNYEYCDFCGDIEWYYKDNTLVISGTGEITDPTWNDSKVIKRDSNYVIIENGITGIGERSFVGLTGLATVVIPDSVKHIGRQAFSTSGLVSVTIPDSVETIEDEAFFSCGELRSLTLSSGLTSVGKQVFEGCWNLKEITIPDSVKTIEPYAFQGCLELMSVTLPSGLTSIGKGAFDNCYNLESINIPDSVEIIEDEAFASCSGLISLELSDGLISIGKGAFQDCSKLTEIAIPDGVETIEDKTFSGCDELISLKLSSGLVSIGRDAFKGCCNLKEVTIPAGVKTIAPFAFCACSELISLKLPSGLISIGKKSFYNCWNLQEITVPDGIETIEEDAFSGCNSLPDDAIEKILHINPDAIEK